MSDLIRSFVALQPDQQLVDSICQWSATHLTGLPEDVRLYPAEKLHLTLAFLGQRSPSFINQLSQELQSLAEQLAPVRISVQQLKLFPSPLKPNYLALMVEPDLSLLDLLAKVERQLLKLGVEPEARSFRPHITLAKLRSGSFEQSPMAENLPQPLNFEPASSNKLVLFNSQLDHQGSKYHPLFSLDLVG